MADNDNNQDEYQFTELDALGNETLDDDESGLNNPGSSITAEPERKDIKRNALITVGVIVVLFVLYKLLASMFGGSAEPVQTGTAPIPKMTTPVQTVVTPAPIEQPQQVITQTDPDLKQKVTALEVSQQGVSAQVNSLGENVGNVNNNVNNINAQLVKMNELITDLSNQLAKQSDELNRLTTHAKPKRVYRPGKAYSKPITYNIQAVIPGRAWLIGSNGSTLTVREGTKIAGYGLVKLIDSMQGRVITSSGQEIRFSQDDS